ncbi:Mss4-like protein [Cladophialophora carrionii]|uniref:Mss4-like protein n=1 Tax=Cladophialophora carrionii TaxID=86049 RepID=A0A1C1C7D3_9EURO|nr:Mss4-like protein [Cladophialophora carrionii]
MSYLPKQATTLTGGCYCKAIRYTINVPSWDDRPIVPGALETPVSATETVQTRMPMVDIDHCNSCRRQAGCLVQCWFIAPIDWVEWDLVPNDGSHGDVLHLSTSEAVGPPGQDKRLPQTFVSRFGCTERATRSFCSRCGTNLSYVNHEYLSTPMAFVDVSVGSLDPESLRMAKVDRHGWWEFGVDWIKTLLSKGDGGFMIKHQTGDVTRSVEG